MKVFILSAFAVIVLAIVLFGAERLGYFMPSQERQAYQARLAVAYEIGEETFTNLYGPASKTEQRLTDLVEAMEAKNPKIVAANRATLERIHDDLHINMSQFDRAAYAHFFARNFTLGRLQRIRDSEEMIVPDIRAMVSWRMRRHELQTIRDRTAGHLFCLIFRDVAPEYQRLGIAGFEDFDVEGTAASCATLFEFGYFDPKNAAVENNRAAKE